MEMHNFLAMKHKNKMGKMPKSKTNFRPTVIQTPFNTIHLENLKKNYFQYNPFNTNPIQYNHNI